MPPGSIPRASMLLMRVRFRCKRSGSSCRHLLPLCGLIACLGKTIFAGCVIFDPASGLKGVLKALRCVLAPESEVDSNRTARWELVVLLEIGVHEIQHVHLLFGQAFAHASASCFVRNVSTS